MKTIISKPAVKRLFAGLVFVFCTLSASAQVYYLNVYQKGGERTRYVIENLDSIKLSYEKAPIEGLAYVDLGLSVKWATFNIGATNPYEPGDYFAWGETQTKDTFTKKTYKYDNPDTIDGYSKYVLNSKYGPVDNKYRLDMTDDAARVNWGSDWRMPTIEEMKELVEECEWEWIVNNEEGYKGYKVTGPNGNSIFMPIAPYRNDENPNSDYNDEYGCASYLTNTLFTDAWNAYGLDIEYELYDGEWYSYFEITGEGRPFGELIRPVYSWQAPDNVSTLTHFEFMEKTVTLEVGQVYQFKYDKDSTAWGEPTFMYPNGLLYQGGGKIKAIIPGNYTVTATLGDFKSEMNIVVSEPEVVAESVDLGLSVKWATCNVGAEKPDKIGYYFAWGETEPKLYYYSYTYKWYDQTTGVYTKYNPNIDGKTVLEKEDDAASQMWGGDWRMPTYEEFLELIYNCNWEWTTENGMTGYRITSMKEGYEGNSIFLPSTSYNNAYVDNRIGCYWTSTAYDEYVGTALYGKTTDSRTGVNINSRYMGYNVRPVLPFGASDADTIMIDQTELTLNIGESTTLKLSGMMETGQPVSVSGGVWSSDDETVATVKDGVVVAEGAGVCTITVEVGGKTLTCAVMVVDPEDFEYVDMGLSVMWATRNVGASKSYEIGGYFAWGETEEKTEYTKNTYAFYDSDGMATKYNLWEEKGEVDNKFRLDPEDDAAAVILGEGWRTPTREEFQELLNYCDWEPAERNGVKGFLVTSYETGNSIFLPLAGEFWGTDTLDYGEYGHYYTNTMVTADAYNSEWAYSACMYHYSNGTYGYVENTYQKVGGVSIRPVRSSMFVDNVIEVTDVTIKQRDITIEAGQSVQLDANVENRAGAELNAQWKSDSSMIARVADNGTVIGINEGQCRIIAYYGDCSDTCLVTVYASKLVKEYVDLGLSVNWATCNIGASRPENVGSYFAWGETEVKGYYSWDNYKYCDGSNKSLTKYCVDPSYGLDGFVDSLTVLEPEDDAAYILWGDDWRMPTVEEMAELINNCSWRWMSENGIAGYLVTSNVEGYTDNSIFIPCCVDEGNVYLWDSSLSMRLTDYASILSGNTVRYVVPRYNGLPIRPVCPKEEIEEPQEPQEPFLVFKYKNLIREVGNTTWLSFDTNVEDDVIFKSSNDSVAVVSEYGQLTTIAEGECIITITAGELSDTCYVTVLDNSSKPQYGFSLDEDSTYCYFSYTVGGLGHGAMAEFYIYDQEVGKIPSDICTSYKAYDFYPTDEAALAAYNVLKDSLSAEVIAEMELTVYDGVVMRTVSEQIGRAKYMVIADMKAEYQGFFPSIPNDSIYNPEEPIVIPETPDSIIIVAEHDFIISEDSLAAEFYYRTADHGYAMAATFGPDSTGAIVCTSILFSFTLSSAEEAQETYENMTAELTDEFIDSLNVVFNDEGTGFSFTNPKVIGMDRDPVLAMMYQSYKSEVDPEIHEEPVVEEGYIGRVQAYLPAEYADSNAVAAWYQWVDEKENSVKYEAVFLFEDGSLVVTKSKFYTKADGRNPELEILATGRYELTDGDFDNGIASVILSDGSEMDVEIDAGVLYAMYEAYVKQKNNMLPEPTVIH